LTKKAEEEERRTEALTRDERHTEVSVTTPVVAGFQVSIDGRF
jgi:hypothetical protein